MARLILRRIGIVAFRIIRAAQLCFKAKPDKQKATIYLEPRSTWRDHIDRATT
jgi:hypothetical protein